MRKFLINVNGNSYEVEVEEIANASADTKRKPDASRSSLDDKKANEAADISISGIKVTAPMSGNIIDLKVSLGDKVAKGDVICILEAMKMENELLSPCDGKVAACNAVKGNAVEADTVLFVIA